MVGFGVGVSNAGLPARLSEWWRSSVVELEVLLYVHRNRRFIRDGKPRTATSTFTQLLSSAIT